MQRKRSAAAAVDMSVVLQKAQQRRVLPHLACAESVICNHLQRIPVKLSTVSATIQCH